MRAYKRYARAGFTLVELMIVVAIIGILAALAIYGVRRYLQSAKTSEAKNGIGAITRGAVGAFERETTPQELLTEGSSGAGFSHDVCAGAVAVPAAPPVGKKYQPNSQSGQDYETGDQIQGWKCLKYTVTTPQYYQYGYQGVRVDSGGALGTAAPAPASGGTLTAPAAGGEFLAWAAGNLDGDTSVSNFGQAGAVNTSTRNIKVATELKIIDEFE